MKKLLLPLLLLLTISGCHCCLHRRGYHVSRYHAPYRCMRHQDKCTCHRHVKEPVYRHVYVAPVYKPVFAGVDECGDFIYERMLIREGYYKEVFAGYRCWHCGKVLR